METLGPPEEAGAQTEDLSLPNVGQVSCMETLGKPDPKNIAVQQRMQVTLPLVRELLTLGRCSPSRVWWFLAGPWFVFECSFVDCSGF